MEGGGGEGEEGWVALGEVSEEEGVEFVDGAGSLGEATVDGRGVDGEDGAAGLNTVEVVRVYCY